MTIKIENAVVGIFQENCRIVYDDETMQGVIVDPGDNANLLLAYVKKLNVDIKAVLITHGHVDHIGAVQLVAKTLKIPIMGPQEEDKFLLEDLHNQTVCFGLPKVEEISLPVTYLNDEQIIEPCRSLTFKVLHTPGHTPGSVCYYCEAGGFVLAGDVIFYQSIGRTDLPRGSYDELIASIKTKLFTLPDDTAVMCGHGPDTAIGREKELNPYV